MPLNNAALNGMAGWLAEHATYLALHSADPGTSGTNETTATRVAAGWPAPTNGSLPLSAKTFTGGPPLGTVTHVGLWSAPTGGTFYGSGELSGDQQFNANGIYNLLPSAVNGASL